MNLRDLHGIDGDGISVQHDEISQLAQPQRTLSIVLEELIGGLDRTRFERFPDGDPLIGLSLWNMNELSTALTRRLTCLGLRDRMNRLVDSRIP